MAFQVGRLGLAAPSSKLSLVCPPPSAASRRLPAAWALSGPHLRKRTQEAAATAAAAATATAAGAAAAGVRASIRRPVREVAAAAASVCQLLPSPLVLVRRCFFTASLAEMPASLLLRVAHELEQDAFAAACGRLSAARLAAAVARAQEAAAASPEGPYHRQGPPKGPPQGPRRGPSPLGPQQEMPLEEAWSCLLFLLHGKLQQLTAAEVGLLLDVLAAAGPLCLRHAARFLSPPAAAAAAADAAAQQQQQQLQQRWGSSEPLEAAASGLPPAAAAAGGAGAAAGTCGGSGLRLRGLLGGPHWRAELLRDAEALLLSKAPGLPLGPLVAALNASLLLLQPFDRLAHALLLPPQSTHGSSSSSNSRSNSSSSSSGDSCCLFVRLLRPLEGPLCTLGSAPAAAAAEAAAARASASLRVVAALGCCCPPAAAAAEVEAAGLIGLWHAALSLNVQLPALAAAAARAAQEAVPLLPLNSLLLLLRCCCMHLTRSSMTYEAPPLVLLPPVFSADGGPPEGALEGSSIERTSPQLEAAAVASLFLRAAERLTQSVSPAGAAASGVACIGSLCPFGPLCKNHAEQQQQQRQQQQQQQPLMHARCVLLLLQPAEATDRLLGTSLLRRVQQMRPQELVLSVRVLRLLRLCDSELLQGLSRELIRHAQDCPLLLLHEALLHLRLLGVRCPELSAEVSSSSSSSSSSCSNSGSSSSSSSSRCLSLLMSCPAGCSNSENSRRGGTRAASLCMTAAAAAAAVAAAEDTPRGVYAAATAGLASGGWPT
ncbi:hypothetical protein Efla_003575 [Eimeria flavescens]